MDMAARCQSGDMGRFSHEALAVDPASNTVYLTEDTGNTSGFYKYVPTDSANVAAGGRLYMLKVAGEWQKNLYTGYPSNSHFPTEWVRDRYARQHVAQLPWHLGVGAGPRQGCGALRPPRRMLVRPRATSTSSRPTAARLVRARSGRYSLEKGFLRLVFESPSSTVLNAPDNLTVSPRGGLVLCEDGGGEEFIHGLTRKGEIFKFAQNNVVLNGEKNGIVGNFSSSEFAGACYSPDGQWLFFNIQSPGITFAVTGPWREGALSRSSPLTSVQSSTFKVQARGR